MLGPLDGRVDQHAHAVHSPEHAAIHGLRLRVSHDVEVATEGDVPWPRVAPRQVILPSRAQAHVGSGPQAHAAGRRLRQVTDCNRLEGACTHNIAVGRARVGVANVINGRPNCVACNGWAGQSDLRPPRARDTLATQRVDHVRGRSCRYGRRGALKSPMTACRLHTSVHIRCESTATLSVPTNTLEGSRLWSSA